MSLTYSGAAAAGNACHDLSPRQYCAVVPAAIVGSFASSDFCRLVTSLIGWLCGDGGNVAGLLVISAQSPLPPCTSGTQAASLRA